MWQGIKREGEVSAKKLKQTKHGVYTSCASRPVCLHTPPPSHSRVYYFVCATLSSQHPPPPAFPCIALSKARALRLFFLLRLCLFGGVFHFVLTLKSLHIFHIDFLFAFCVTFPEKTQRYPFGVTGRSSVHVCARSQT